MFGNYSVNHDIDWTRPQDAQTNLTTVRAISALLRAVNEVVKQPTAFPEAQIILGGMANLWKCPDCPGRFLDARELYHLLADVEGVDVIGRFADGVGLHLYPPDSDELPDWVNDIVLQSWNALSPSARKPLWITEWGFQDTITGGETRRLELFEQVIDTLNARPEPLGYGYIYNFDEDGLRFNLYDPSTHTLREPAEIFTRRPL
jgi:hypothetical protein